MPHFLTECIPIDMSEAEFAPMYFQKAFQEAEGLWATNKAVINTMKEQSHYKKVPPQLGKSIIMFNRTDFDWASGIIYAPWENAIDGNN